jgi:hypothetical protein
MTVPPLPTDNLYKFLALSGLVLCGVCFWYPHAQIYRLLGDDIRWRTDAEVVKIQYEYLKADIERLGKVPTNSLSAAEVAELRQRNQQLEVARAELDGKRQQIIITLDELRGLQHLRKAGLAFGMFLWLLGFWLWFRRVQLPLDAMLRKQVSAKDAAE